eukprot:4207065-Pleurochrysis_carterae.AAC.2
MSQSSEEENNSFTNDVPCYKPVHSKNWAIMRACLRKFNDWQHLPRPISQQTSNMVTHSPTAGPLDKIGHLLRCRESEDLPGICSASLLSPKSASRTRAPSPFAFACCVCRLQKSRAQGPTPCCAASVPPVGGQAQARTH